MSAKDYATKIMLYNILFSIKWWQELWKNSLEWIQKGITVIEEIESL